MRRRRPLISLTTDFGSTDSYVAEMKGVLLSLAPEANLIDVTHHIAPHDVAAGAFTLDRVIRAFPKGSLHLAVVDPGVGSDRRILLSRVRDQVIVCPDNGLISWVFQRNSGVLVYEMTWRPRQSSATFHGRDVMAPIIGRLSAGEPWRRFVGGRVAPVLLDMPVANSLEEAKVVHIDHFGNATTNVSAELLGGVDGATIVVRRRRVPLKKTYADVAPGTVLALVGSSGLLEIAVRNGSAAQVLGVSVGSRVSIR